MGKRNVFYDDKGNELSCYVQESGNLYIEIKELDGSVKSIALGKTDAVLLILDLYRMKKSIVSET